MLGLFLVLLGPVPGAGAANLDAAAGEVAGGAGGLALDTLSQAPPEPGDAEWPRWARLRVQALEVQGRWRRVVELADNVPDNAPAGYRRWVGTRAARLLLDHGRPTAARRRAAGLIAAHPEAKEPDPWLRLVYRAYAAEGRGPDAREAIRRFRQGKKGEALSASLRREQARIVRETGEVEAALELLQAEPEDPAERRLRLELRLVQGEGEAVLEEAMAWAEEASGQVSRGAWEIAVRAARDLDRHGEELQALEALVATAPDPDRVRIERAWETYLLRGELLADKAGLQVGQDAKWLGLARDKEAGVDRRALLASVALTGQEEAPRRDARQALIQALVEADRGRAALALFRLGPAFQSEDALSPEVTGQLGRVALRQKRFGDARHWMARQGEPPESMAPGDWWLTRARLAVKVGAFDAGEAHLKRILEADEPFPRSGSRDRFLQVVFDLQEAGQHARALRLLKGLRSVVEASKAQREILFWMAESREKLGAFREAASLYLRSAAHPAGERSDPWGRTARFRAAKALEKTDHNADARRIYKALLGAGSNGQTLAIKRRLRQLDVEGSGDGK